MRYRINRSMVEYTEGHSNLQQNEGLLISHSVVMNCGVSLHLSSMKVTWAVRKRNLLRPNPPVFIIWSNSYTRICDSCLPLYASITLQLIEEIWCGISRNPTKTISSMKVNVTRDIEHKLCMYDLATSFNRRPVSRAAIVIASYWAACLYILVLLIIHTPVKDCYWSKHLTSLPISWWSMPGHPASLETHLIIVLWRSIFIISCLEARA